jgi:hypothetical protein
LSSAPISPTISSFAETIARTCDSDLRVLAQREGHVVVDAHRSEQGAVLEEHAEEAPHLVQVALGQPGQVLVADPYRAPVGLQQADQRFQEDRLAGTGRAQQDRDLARGQGQAHVGPHRTAIEGLGQPFDAYLDAHPLLQVAGLHLDIERASGRVTGGVAAATSTLARSGRNRA